MRLGWALALVLIGGATATAESITPTFDSWGSFPEATFDGREIPHDSVAVSTFVHEGKTITLALSVSQRSDAAPVTNDSAGTFYVTPGVVGGTSEQSPAEATWNLNYYANVSDGSLIGSGYVVRLLYDFDPAVGTQVAQHGTLLRSTIASTLQGSENLTTFFPWIWSTTSPPTAFDPTLDGEYTFAIQVLKATGGSVPPLSPQQTTSRDCCVCGDCNAAPEPVSNLSWQVLDTMAAVRVVSARKGRGFASAPDFGSSPLMKLASNGFSGSSGFGGTSFGGGGFGNGFPGGTGGGVGEGFSGVPSRTVLDSFPSQQPTITLPESNIPQPLWPPIIDVVDPEVRSPNDPIPPDDPEQTPGIEDHDDNLVATPEPSTLALLGMSTIGIGGRFLRRRGRRKI